jgi:hypothetical protein
MSRIRLTQVAAPSPNPPATTAEIYYDSTGLGTPAAVALQAIDNSGNKIVLGHFAILDYRLINVRVLTTSTSYVPTAGARALYVECIGGGGQGGGAATSSSTCSVGTGGGGGGYSAKFLTGAAVKNPTTYAIGAGGSTSGAGAAGQAGGNTTWDTSVVVANGGAGGLVLAAGSTNIAIIPPAIAAVGTGDVAVTGSLAGFGYRISGTVIGWSGMGGSGPLGGGAGNMVIATITNGGAATANTGAGGGGAATLSTAATGGAGGSGWIRVWEFA